MPKSLSALLFAIVWTTVAVVISFVYWAGGSFGGSLPPAFGFALVLGFSFVVGLLIRQNPQDYVVLQIFYTFLIGLIAYRGDHPFVLLAIPAFAIVFALIAAIVLKRHDGILFGQMRKLFEFMIHRSPYAWALGAFLGSLVAVAFLLFSSMPDQACTQPDPSVSVAELWRDRAQPCKYVRDYDAGFGATIHWKSTVPEAFALFLTVLTTVLGISIFYRRFAPITDLPELLIELERDLISCLNEKESAWFCFPGFALGGYRSFEHDGKANGMFKYFDGFRTELQKVMQHHNDVKFLSVRYPLSVLERFYERYDMVNSEHPSKAHVEAVMKEERALAGVCDPYNRHFEIAPQFFPPHVIVLGNVVYTISTFAMPIYKPSPTDDIASGKFEGQFVGGEAGLARLYAYRIDDRHYADGVRKHLQNFVEAYENVSGAKP